jgi:lysyl-tRNA synthetase class 2
MIRRRARLLQEIRAFFRKAGVLEVETPVCSRFAATDPAIESFETDYQGPGVAQGSALYLQTSPEFFMKRLLCAGIGSIYQICKVFRNGEWGRRHHPEFTLLEWYRVGYDHHDLMDEVARLIQNLHSAELSVEKYTYQEIFEHRLQLNPHQADMEQLRQCAIAQKVPNAEDLVLHHCDQWLDLLLTHLIEPHLGNSGLTFVYDYPTTQAALAKIREGTPPVAERFELYWKGVEIANGFHELQDSREQRLRFEDDNRERQRNGLPFRPMDQWLLEALSEAMPPSAGVAIGIDRLMMTLYSCCDIREVVCFDFSRA